MQCLREKIGFDGNTDDDVRVKMNNTKTLNTSHHIIIIVIIRKTEKPPNLKFNDMEWIYLTSALS